MNILKDKPSVDELSLDKLSSDKPTTNIFVLEFDIYSLQGKLEVNDLTVAFTVSSLQELKEEYEAVTIVEVVDNITGERVLALFSKDVLDMIQDELYEYAVEEYKNYFGDE